MHGSRSHALVSQSIGVTAASKHLYSTPMKPLYVWERPPGSKTVSTRWTTTPTMAANGQTTSERTSKGKRGLQTNSL